MNDDLARNRWIALAGTRLAGSFGALFGLLLIGRTETLGPKVLGAAIVLSALAMIAVVPRALARRWRTPDA